MQGISSLVTCNLFDLRFTTPRHKLDSVRQTIYIETSVLGTYLDNGDPLRRDLTIRWWEHEMDYYRATTSLLVKREIEMFSEPHRAAGLKLMENLPVIKISDEAAILAESYLSRGIFQRKFLADAMHVAIASINEIDFLVTWDFGHLLNIRRQARIRAFNKSAGFHTPTIITPEFLVHG